MLSCKPLALHNWNTIFLGDTDFSTSIGAYVGGCLWIDSCWFISLIHSLIVIDTNWDDIMLKWVVEYEFRLNCLHFHCGYLKSCGTFVPRRWMLRYGSTLISTFMAAVWRINLINNKFSRLWTRFFQRRTTGWMKIIKKWTKNEIKVIREGYATNGFTIVASCWLVSNFKIQIANGSYKDRACSPICIVQEQSK